jgi:hypothetical protein
MAQGSITTSGDPPPLTATGGLAGADLVPGVNSSTTYTVVVLGLGLGIIGQLDAPMPANTALRVTLAAPSGAASIGPVDLAITPQTLVRALQLGTFSGLPITYEFRAQVEAGVVPPTSRTVTFTVTAVP